MARSKPGKVESVAAMPDDSGAAAADSDSDESGKKKISNRDWIDDAGKVVPEDEATGVRYEFIGRTNKDGTVIPGDGKATTVYFRDLQTPALHMGCGFGLLTLLGNITNTWLGDKSDDKWGTAYEAIAARLDGLNNGQWIDRSGGGPRIDRTKLAEAVVAVLTLRGKYTADEGPAKVAEQIAKFDTDPKWMTSVRAIPEVSAKYNELMGRTVATIDDLMKNA